MKIMLLPDQSAINKLSKDKLIVERIYNEQRFETEEAVFRHFSTTFRLFPYLHTVNVKPWQTDKVESILNTHLYDEIINKYKNYLKLIPKKYWE